MSIETVAELERDLFRLADLADVTGAVSWVHDLPADLDVEMLVTQVIVPVQRQVGELEASGQWSTADEHVASNVVEHVVAALAGRLPAPSRPGRVAIVCGVGEWHVLPARLMAMRLRAAGHDVEFLGGSTPDAALLKRLTRRRPDALLVSTTVSDHVAGAVASARTAAALGIPAAIGGGGVERGDLAALPSDVTRLTDLEQSLDWLGS